MRLLEMERLSPPAQIIVELEEDGNPQMAMPQL